MLLLLFTFTRNQYTTLRLYKSTVHCTDRMISLTTVFSLSSSLCAREHTEQPWLFVWCTQRNLAVNRLHCSVPHLRGEQHRSRQQLWHRKASLHSTQHAVRSDLPCYSVGPRWGLQQLLQSHKAGHYRYVNLIYSTFVCIKGLSILYFLCMFLLCENLESAIVQVWKYKKLYGSSALCILFSKKTKWTCCKA